MLGHKGLSRGCKGLTLPSAQLSDNTRLPSLWGLSHSLHPTSPPRTPNLQVPRMGSLTQAPGCHGLRASAQQSSFQAQPPTAPHAGSAAPRPPSPAKQTPSQAATRPTPLHPRPASRYQGSGLGSPPERPLHRPRLIPTRAARGLGPDSLAEGRPRTRLGGGPSGAQSSARTWRAPPATRSAPHSEPILSGAA